MSSAKQQLTQAIATNERISGSIYVDVNFSSHPSISVYHCHCLSICTMRHKHQQNGTDRSKPAQFISILHRLQSPFLLRFLQLSFLGFPMQSFDGWTHVLSVGPPIKPLHIDQTMHRKIQKIRSSLTPIISWFPLSRTHLLRKTDGS